MDESASHADPSMGALRPMTQLCALGTHVIQQLPTGRYVCVYACGLQLTEYHELVVGGGAGAVPQGEAYR